MATDFSRTLSLLRQDKGVSQRKAAAELGISQALLSHYENGAREPGLAFICRVCDYYGVTADYLLCRSEEPEGAAKIADMGREFLSRLRDMADGAEKALNEYDREGSK